MPTTKSLFIYMWKSQVDFSTAGKELTPTMKMARHAILKKYANEVGTLAYGDDSDDYDDDDQGDLDDGSRVMILIIVCHDIFQKYAVEVRTVLHDNDYGDDDFGNLGEDDDGDDNNQPSIFRWSQCTQENSTLMAFTAASPFDNHISKVKLCKSRLLCPVFMCLLNLDLMEVLLNIVFCFQLKQRKVQCQNLECIN